MESRLDRHSHSEDCSASLKTCSPSRGKENGSLLPTSDLLLETRCPWEGAMSMVQPVFFTQWHSSWENKCFSLEGRGSDLFIAVSTTKPNCCVYSVYVKEKKNGEREGWSERKKESGKRGGRISGRDKEEERNLQVVKGDLFLCICVITTV